MPLRDARPTPLTAMGLTFQRLKTASFRPTAIPAVYVKETSNERTDR
jgi:hypothetical protein